jgi:hypothetical protein
MQPEDNPRAAQFKTGLGTVEDAVERRATAARGERRMKRDRKLRMAREPASQSLEELLDEWNIQRASFAQGNPHAARALRYLLGAAEFRRLRDELVPICRDNLIPRLLDFCQNPNDDLREQSVAALCNLCGTLEFAENDERLMAIVTQLFPAVIQVALAHLQRKSTSVTRIWQIIANLMNVGSASRRALMQSHIFLQHEHQPSVMQLAYEEACPSIVGLVDFINFVAIVAWDPEPPAWVPAFMWNNRFPALLTELWPSEVGEDRTTLENLLQAMFELTSLMAWNKLHAIITYDRESVRKQFGFFMKLISELAGPNGSGQLCGWLVGTLANITDHLSLDMLYETTMVDLGCFELICTQLLRSPSPPILSHSLRWLTNLVWINFKFLKRAAQADNFAALFFCFQKPGNNLIRANACFAVNALLKRAEATHTAESDAYLKKCVQSNRYCQFSIQIAEHVAEPLVIKDIVLTWQQLLKAMGRTFYNEMDNCGIVEFVQARSLNPGIHHELRVPFENLRRLMDRVEGEDEMELNDDEPEVTDNQPAFHF